MSLTIFLSVLIIYSVLLCAASIHSLSTHKGIYVIPEELVRKLWCVNIAINSCIIFWALLLL